MKKLIFSGALAVALLCSVSLMAQDVNKKKEPTKQKTEVKAEQKETTAKSEATKGEKKATPTKTEKKQPSTPKAQ